MIRLLSATVAMLAVPAFFPLPAAAQGSDFFVPSQSRPAAPVARPAPRPAPAPQAPAAQPGFIPGPGTEADLNPQVPQVPMPPVPELPALPKATPPPALVLGVIGVPDVMRASTAAQQVDKAIGERREKLNADAQKEQAAWREMQQTLANQRGTMSADQIRGHERDLQQRITSAQRQFRDRTVIIQEAAQYALNQIQATLIAVIRQVAESHSMNVVLHRPDVALNQNAFDITDEVSGQLNKLLASVTIPPDGVSPLTLPTPPTVAGLPPATGAPIKTASPPPKP